ncbi:MAG: type II toxin-antitoxin system VapB family antitoxin [Terrimicrobiaceae bacterium]
MKTTIDIPENELKDAIKFTGARSKRAAVLHALVDFNRRKRMAGLIRHSGSFGTFPTIAEIREPDAQRDELIGAR